ncbi:MAG: FAD-dependent oxidoreductase [Planctomycetes bacterium]|nr:FAD-dependent oxidoreductase [Planctomycetota bacterium]
MPTCTFTRDMQLDDGWDVCVLGGGPAGAAAAIAAGRLGARTVLIENTGCLGGMGTSGLVTAFDPMANGQEMLVGGIMREIVETLDREGELGPGVGPEVYAKGYMRWTPFRVEGYKRLLDRLATQAGVEVRFFTRLCDAEAGNGVVRGVVLNNVEGWRMLRARTYIDCTGDAVLAAAAGAACREAGRDTPRIMPATMASYFSGPIDWSRCGWQAQQDGLKRALADGFFTQRDRHMPGFSRVGDSLGYLNSGHLFNLDALRCRDLSDGAMLGRRLAKEYLEFFRRYVPGCERLEHATTASLLGIRESRRIVGEYELTVGDYLARRHFPDQIGLFNKFIDIHPYDCSDAEYERFRAEKDDGRWKLGPGESFGIPYGVLVPRGWSNLWVAGRCVSSDLQVHGVIRVQPAAAMMGQAAGSAAVQSVRSGQTACGLDTAALVSSLRDQGAHLPQTALATTATRS